MIIMGMVLLCLAVEVVVVGRGGFVGRDFKEVDLEKLISLVGTDLPQKVIADELGISIPTLAKRMAEISDKQGILLKYRELQSLQLTSLQARVLEAITPQKINEATLRDLVLAFRVLKDKEMNIEGKPTEIKGLVHYLLELEREENIVDCEQYTDQQFEEAADAAALVTAIPEVTAANVEDPDFLPDL